MNAMSINGVSMSQASSTCTSNWTALLQLFIGFQVFP